MPAEQLHLTRIRIAEETALGSAAPDPDGWIEPPMTAAAVSRELVSTAARVDVFGQSFRKDVIASTWGLRTEHELGLPWLLWILKRHMTARPGGIWTLDPEAPDPSFVIETQSPAGEVAQYSGCRISEIQIEQQERRLVTCKITWLALERDTPEDPAPEAAGESVNGPLCPTHLATVAATTGAWDPDPRATQSVTHFAGQLILRREIEATNYSPDGYPQGFIDSPWQVLAELLTPQINGLTDAAFDDEWNGKLAFFPTAGTEHLRVNASHGFIQDEDLLAFDWRVRRIAAQALSDYRRALVELWA